MDRNAILEVARKAAEKGGDVLLRNFQRSVDVREKAAADLVSAADLESEQVIAETLHQAFPEHAILGEENHNGDVEAEHLWIVDPLDGTTNYLHGIPHYAVSIAFYERGEPVCGVVYNPSRNDWYVAVKGRGATHNGEAARVAATSQLSESLVGVGFYYDRGAMMEATLNAIRDLFQGQIHGVRRFGTASLDLCHVGLGLYGAFFEYQLAPWDFAAGRLFVEEAGGQVTDCLGAPLALRKGSVLASNGHLHAAVRDVVSRYCPADS